MKTHLICAAAAAFFATSANAQQWFAEEGQGLRSAGVEDGSSSILINCVTTGANVDNSIMVGLSGAMPSGPVEFDFGDGTVISAPVTDGVLRAESGSARQIFGQIVQMLKFGSQVTVRDTASGAAHSFPLRGSSRAIGACTVPHAAIQADPSGEMATGTASVAAPSASELPSSITAQQPIPGDPFTDYRIAECAGTSGFGVLQYGTLAETGIRLSDICVLEADGAVLAAESVSDLTLTVQSPEGRAYEDLTTGKPEYQRNTVRFVPDENTGGCAEGVESFEYTVYDSSVKAFPDTSFAMLTGYTTEVTAPRPAGAQAEVLLGLRLISQAELADKTMPIASVNAEGDTYGQAVFDGDTGTLTILHGGGATYGKSSGSLAFQFFGNGEFLATGDLSVSSNRIAGHAPTDMVSLSGTIPYLRGHILGADGTELLGYGLFRGSYGDASGAEHQIRASAYLMSCVL